MRDLANRNVGTCKHVPTNANRVAAKRLGLNQPDGNAGAFFGYAVFRELKMMSAQQEIGMLLGIDAEARRLERERVLAMFASLADQMDIIAGDSDDDIGLVWTAAAASVRRVCNEAESA